MTLSDKITEMQAFVQVVGKPEIILSTTKQDTKKKFKLLSHNVGENAMAFFKQNPDQKSSIKILGEPYSLPEETGFEGNLYLFTAQDEKTMFTESYFTAINNELVLEEGSIYLSGKRVNTMLHRIVGQPLIK